MTANPRTCLSCSTPLPEDAIYCHMCGTPTPTSIDRETGAPTVIPVPPGVAARATSERLQTALGPNYEVLHLVGRGGFAEVFAVRDNRLRRELAVKVLRPELVLSDVLLERFRREAEAVAALRHPSIVPIYDVGEGEGLAYIIMPLIKGETLRSRLDRVGRPSLDEAEMILLEAAGALAVAHEEGMVHRDIKPENIMLEGRSSRVLLMDFGIAKAVDASAGELTQSGMIIGTPQYMSPEQAAGEKSIDHRADQYGLAVVGFRMLTGRLPFEGDSTRSVLYRQLVESPPEAHRISVEVPIELSAVIGRAMSKERQDRFPNIEEFAAAVIRFRASHTPIPLSTPTGIRMAAISGLGPAPFADRPSGAAEPPTPPAGSLPAPVPSLSPSADAPIAPPPLRPSAGRRAPPRFRLGRIVLVGLVAGLVGLVLWVGFRSQVSPAATIAADSITKAVAESLLGDSITTGAPTVATRPAPAPARSGEEREGRRRPAPPPPAATPELSRSSCAQLFAAFEWDQAVATCTNDAEAGSAPAQRALGSLYALGHGTPVDYTRAATWWTRAADAGDPEATYLLAELYDNGRGVQRDRERATALYRKAGDTGHLQAQLALGLRYDRGDGAKKDQVESATWYRKAAEQGYVRAQAIMAALYRNGRGVEKDLTESVRWLRMAAATGDAEAQYLLGVSYDKGEGVGRSESEAIKWWELAAAQGHRQSREELRKRGR